MREANVHQKKTTDPRHAYGLFIRRGIDAGGERGGMVAEKVRATGEDIRQVRQLLGESQAVFAGRFARDRRTVIRWEQDGHRFTDNKPNVFLCRYTYREIWQLTCSEACTEMRVNRYG